jgi:hypothetical protein
MSCWRVSCGLSVVLNPDRWTVGACLDYIPIAWASSRAHAWEGKKQTTPTWGSTGYMLKHFGREQNSIRTPGLWCVPSPRSRVLAEVLQVSSKHGHRFQLLRRRHVSWIDQKRSNWGPQATACPRLAAAARRALEQAMGSRAPLQLQVKIALIPSRLQSLRPEQALNENHLPNNIDTSIVITESTSHLIIDGNGRLMLD